MMVVVFLVSVGIFLISGGLLALVAAGSKLGALVMIYIVLTRYLTDPTDPGEFIDLVQRIERFWLNQAQLPPIHYNLLSSGSRSNQST